MPAPTTPIHNPTHAAAAAALQAQNLQQQFPLTTAEGRNQYLRTAHSVAVAAMQQFNGTLTMAHVQAMLAVNNQFIPAYTLAVFLAFRMSWLPQAQSFLQNLQTTLTLLPPPIRHLVWCVEQLNGFLTQPSTFNAQTALQQLIPHPIQAVMAEEKTYLGHMYLYRQFFIRLLQHRLASKLATAPASPATPALHVLGDSHTFSLSNLNVPLQGETHHTRGQLVFGCKLFHLTPAFAEKNAGYRAIFQQKLAALPAGSRVVVTVGEIDCRHNEGFLPYFQKHTITSTAARQHAIHTTTQAAVGFVHQLAAEHDHRLMWCNVPAPNPLTPAMQQNLTEWQQVITLFNTSLATVTNTLQLQVLNLHALTEGQNGTHHLDGAHLKPQLYAAAFQALG